MKLDLLKYDFGVAHIVTDPAQDLFDLIYLHAPTALSLLHPSGLAVDDALREPDAFVFARTLPEETS